MSVSAVPLGCAWLTGSAVFRPQRRGGELPDEGVGDQELDGRQVAGGAAHVSVADGVSGRAAVSHRRHVHHDGHQRDGSQHHQLHRYAHAH